MLLSDINFIPCRPDHRTSYSPEQRNRHRLKCTPFAILHLNPTNVVCQCKHTSDLPIHHSPLYAIINAAPANKRPVDYRFHNRARLQYEAAMFCVCFFLHSFWQTKKKLFDNGIGIDLTAGVRCLYDDGRKK